VSALLRKDDPDEQVFKNANFGIDLLKQAKSWETAFSLDLAAGRSIAEVYAIFTVRLKWLQHERLVHLLVLMMTVIAFLFAFGTALFLPGTAAIWILTLILSVLTVAYVIHYYKLENLVQRWYLMESEILKYTEKDE